MGEYNMKVLPINVNPYIRAFTEYAYVDAIISSDFRNEKTMLRAELSEKITDDWIIDAQQATITIDGASFAMEENYLSVPHTKHIYRTLKANDELVIRIDHQQYTNLWDAVGLFAEQRVREIDGVKRHMAMFESNCGSHFSFYHYEDDESFFFLKEDKKDYPVYVRLNAEETGFSFSYSLDGTEWIQTKKYDCELKGHENEYCVGVYIALSERQYYKWIFNNFINYRLDLNNGSALNYTNFIKRDCKSYTINPIVRISTEKLSVLEKCNVDILDFVKANIDENRYLEFWLNEGHIPELEIERIHESLIYGYDEEKKLLNVMSIKMGKPYVYQLHMRDFVEALKDSDKRLAGYCYVFEHKTSDAPYELDIDGIVTQLREYCEGYNCTLSYKRLIAPEPGVYGIACYDSLLKESAARELFLSDFRIAYLLHEHKKCMKDRVEYLIALNYLEREKNQDIVNMCNDIHEKAMLLMMRAVKYYESARESLAVKMFELLRQIKEEELKCYPLLIERLMENRIS